MPIDAFQAAGISSQSQQPIDAFQAAGIVNNPSQTQAQPSSPLMNLGKDILNYEGAGGLYALSGLARAGLGLTNAPHNIVSAISPQIGAHIPSTSFTSQDIDKVLGTTNPNLGEKAIQGVAQYTPYALGAEVLGGAGLLSDVGTGLAYGATQSQDPFKGAITAGLTNLGIGAAARFVPSAISYIQPQKFAQKIIDFLSKGKTLEENGQTLAQNIQKAYKAQIADAQKSYDPVFNAIGNKNIYEGLPGEQKGAYGALDNNVTGNYDLDTRDLHNDFTSNSTFKSGSDLRKQLGANIRALQKNPAPDAATRLQIQSYQRAQDAIDNDLESYLNRTNPDLAAKYQEGNNKWFSNVVPYQADRDLFAMARGKIKNPTNTSIASIFKNPEADIQKVANDLPQDSKDQILYSMLGKTSATKSPENLIAAFKNLDQQGLHSYVSPDLENQLGSLESRIKARNLSQMGAGALAALGAAHPLSGMISAPMLDTAALGIGGYLGPVLGKSLSKALPQSANASSISLHPALVNALQHLITPALVNRFGGPQ